MVGDRALKVTGITSVDDFKINYQGQSFRVTDKEWTALEPGVEVISMTYRPGPRKSTIRVRIEAPSFKIYRVKPQGVAYELS